MRLLLPDHVSAAGRGYKTAPWQDGSLFGTARKTAQISGLALMVAEGLQAFLLSGVGSGEQTVGFSLHHSVALAAQCLEHGPFQHGDAPTGVLYGAEPLQLSGGFGDAFAADAKHVGNELMEHDQDVILQTVKREQKPPASLRSAEEYYGAMLALL